MTPDFDNGTKMEYRRLGRSGLRVSVLGFGSWISFDGSLDTEDAIASMQAARDAGCNFFDNAEAYAGGRSEAMMGRALRELGWDRNSYVVTTKFYWGIDHENPNMHFTLNRKYLRAAIEASLERFDLDFVDIAYCHRADPETPMEETVTAMSEMVTKGQANYWGTSEWSAQEIRHAIDIADRHGLIAPVTEQSEYNLLARRRVEDEYARLHAETGYGNTIWSPLKSGILTGKYQDGIPEDSRLAQVEMLRGNRTDEAVARVERLRPIADRIGCSLAQLAIAWATQHPMVSSVITGASRPSQVTENFEALDVIPELTADLNDEIDRIFG